MLTVHGRVHAAAAEKDHHHHHHHHLAVGQIIVSNPSNPLNPLNPSSANSTDGGGPAAAEHALAYSCSRDYP